MARQKLEAIIRREGDAGGERRKPYYLAALVQELEQGQAMTEYCLKTNKGTTEELAT